MFEEECKRFGVDPQLIDFEAEIDSSLTYPENRENLSYRIGSASICYTASEREIRQRIKEESAKIEGYEAMSKAYEKRQPKQPKGWNCIPIELIKKCS